MAVTYNAESQNTTPANPISITPGATADDVILIVTVTDALATPSALTNFDILVDQDTTSDNQTLAVYRKKDASGSEGALSVGSNQAMICLSATFSGVNNTTPEDVTAVVQNNNTATASPWTISASITPVTDGCMIVAIMASDTTSSVDAAHTFATTSGTTGSWTNQNDINSGFYNVAIATCTQTTAEAITVEGTGTAGGASAGRSIALIALRPADSSSVDQSAFRFGEDDANEASHTWTEAENTNITATDSQTKLLRVQVEASGDPLSYSYTLRYQKNGSGGYTAVPVGASVETTPVIEAGDCTVSGNNTAEDPWAVSYPNASTGDLLIFYVAWDDSTTTTTVTAPSGPNGETLTSIAGPISDNSTETRAQAWYTVATGSWTASTLSFNPNATESWTATCVRVPAGEFEAATPIGASGTSTSGASTSDVTVDSPAFSAGASDGGGKLVVCHGIDADPLGSAPAGWTNLQTQDLGAVAHGVAVRTAAVTDSESIASAAWSIAGDSWTSIAFVVRAPTVNNECYVATSANIAASGEATTARLSVPGGKTFDTGRRWDDENGTDATDLGSSRYTEFEWAVALSSAPSDGDYFEFRVYKGTSVLTAYDYTPKWTVGSSGSPFSITSTATATFSGTSSASAAVSIASTSTATFVGSSSNSADVSILGMSTATFNGSAAVSAYFSVVAASTVEWAGESSSISSAVFDVQTVSDLQWGGVSTATGELNSQASGTVTWGGESAASGSVSIPAVSLIEWIGESIAQSEGVFSVSATSDVEWIGESIATAEFFVTAQSVANFSGSSSESDTENTDSLEAWKYIQKTWPQEQIAKRKKIAQQNAEFFKLVEMAFPMMLQEQLNQTKH